MKVEDRRVKKTKKAITNALITLLQTKELHAITVKELTEIADIHRATFYVHYEDIYDLYQQTEDQVMESVSFILRKDAIHSYEAAYADLIVYVLENKEISKMLFGASAMKSFQKRVVKCLEETYLSIWMSEDKIDVVTTKMKMLTAYHVQGSMAIMNKWMEDDFNSPMNEIVKLFKELDDNFEVLINKQ